LLLEAVSHHIPYENYLVLHWKSETNMNKGLISLYRCSSTPVSDEISRLRGSLFCEKTDEISKGIHEAPGSIFYLSILLCLMINIVFQLHCCNFV
jgi:hypothetical protein